MKFKEAHNTAKDGEKITYGSVDAYVVKRNISTNISWSDGDNLKYAELFENDRWYVKTDKVKVECEGKVVYLSRESAKALNFI